MCVEEEKGEVKQSGKIEIERDGLIEQHLTVDVERYNPYSSKQDEKNSRFLTSATGATKVVCAFLRLFWL